MERLTTWRSDGRAAIANPESRAPAEQMKRISEVIERLAVIEDILGNSYDLNHLREAVSKQEEYKQFMKRWEYAVEIAGIVKNAGGERIMELLQADREKRCVILPSDPAENHEGKPFR